jgi:hypothetical protein
MFRIATESPRHIPMPVPPVRIPLSPPLKIRMILRLLHYFWERRVRSPNQSPNEGTPAAIWLPEWVHKSARLIAISCWSVIVSNGTSRPELAYRPTGPRSVGWPVGRLALLSQPTCDLCSHRGSFSKIQSSRTTATPIPNAREPGSAPGFPATSNTSPRQIRPICQLLSNTSQATNGFALA